MTDEPAATPDADGLPEGLWGSQRDFYSFSPESLGATLPQFEILREVGKGSMGIVYEAKVRASGQRIALKILPPSLTLTERALARFLREGRIMRRITHPDIVGYLDQGHAERLHWFAMEFVDGTTLQERLQVGPLPIRQTCEIGARVGRALHFAHDHGVVHRDVKPGNLMLRNGGAGLAITDFGLARETGTGSMTDSGALVGTPIYMAPELVLHGSAQLSISADVYSLGATLYHMLTGQPPFAAPTAQGVLKAVIEQEPTPARQLRREIPLALCAVLGKAMHRDPRRRYGSALELAEDLERLLANQRVTARLPNAAERTARAIRRRPIASLLTLGALLAAYFGVLWQQDRLRAEQQAQIGRAERLVALAASRDDHDRPRAPSECRELLLQATQAASAVIQAADQTPARLARARAHLRLRLFEDALIDLDAAERLAGAATVELLLMRIDALRQSSDRTQLSRLQHDLTTLLRLDPTTNTRFLVAEHLLDLAEPLVGRERLSLAQAALDVLSGMTEGDARSSVLMARVLEVRGESEHALAAMQRAREQYRGDLYVHLQAAAMFERHGLFSESASETDIARRLQPDAAVTAPLTGVDLDGVGRFLGDVDRLLQAIDGKPGKQ